MSEVVIKVENLSKRYRLGERESYRALRDILASSVTAPVKRLFGNNGKRKGTTEEPHIWALKDVSFEVKRGEVVGIIGRNGAGKSTLLKILSRITRPTSGYAEINGRVGSLLEVGTGFHPELTGRENIYLNGAILGMRKAGIRKKFDEIVDFAEVERFLDTPVKRYSSGMYVRLAFAVAAHLEPEVLLVDEVLAVGDAHFQKKCLGKIEDVAQQGRTVLFVSHNMATVSSLCTRGFLLSSGNIAASGRLTDILSIYMQEMVVKGGIHLADRSDRRGGDEIRLMSIEVTNQEENPVIRCSDELCVKISYASPRELSKAVFLVRISDQFNRAIFFLNSEATGWSPERLPAKGTITCRTGPINISPMACTLNLAVLEGGVIRDQVKQACTFDVQVDDFYGTGKSFSQRDAMCLVKHRWQFCSESPE